MALLEKLVEQITNPASSRVKTSLVWVVVTMARMRRIKRFVWPSNELDSLVYDGISMGYSRTSI